jgi:hypothetical protein
MKLRETSRDRESDRLAERVAKLEERLFAAVGRIGQLEQENARLREENGAKSWTWCFRARLYTLFRIDKSRGSKVLVEVLGAAGFQRALEAAREQVLKVATTRVPEAIHARNLAKRFRENGNDFPGFGPVRFGSQEPAPGETRAKQRDEGRQQGALMDRVHRLCLFTTGMATAQTHSSAF